MILAVALLAGAASSTPLVERVPDVATHFCVDLVSRAVPVPRVGADETRVFARYDLVPGIPQAAMKALGQAGTTAIAGATLASGEASDGSFIVALGGAAGETCRVIVYRASTGANLPAQVGIAMGTKALGWKALPNPVQSTVATRLSFLKRDSAGRPMIANLLAPVVFGPIALVANVATVPPTVRIPQGY